MWKVFVAFIVFAAAALLILSKAGGDVDMGGEKHGTEAQPVTEQDKPAAPSASAAAAPVVATRRVARELTAAALN